MNEQTLQIMLSILTVGLLPLLVWFFKHTITKRDKKLASQKEAEAEIINVKLDSMIEKIDNSDKNMLEFRGDIRTDITLLHSRVSDFKDSNERAHGEIWKETNSLRERVATVEGKHEGLMTQLKEAKNG